MTVELSDGVVDYFCCSYHLYCYRSIPYLP